MWGQSLPWHKVLNAVVAELSIYKWRNQRGRIDSLLPWVSRLNERLSAKLRVTENRCVLFNSFTYIYIYVLYKYFKRKKGRNYILVASFFPLKIFVPLCFNVLSTVPRENRLADSLCPIYISPPRLLFGLVKTTSVYTNNNITFSNEINLQFDIVNMQAFESLQKCFLNVSCTTRSCPSQLSFSFLKQKSCTS